MITQTYNLNLVPSENQVIVNASQYDEGSRRIEFILYHGRDLFDINDYEQKNNVICNVRVLGTKADGTGYMYDCGFSHSKVFFDIQEQMTVLAGQHTAEIRIVDNEDNIIGSSNFIFQIEKAALKDDTVISETDIPLLQRIINNIDSINAVETMLDGGTTGQVLAKKSDTDGDVWWINPGQGGDVVWGEIGGILTDQTDLKNVLDTKANVSDVYTKENVDTLLDGKASATDLSNHIQDDSNPHRVTKAQVGLGNVDNTSDLDKPISNATQNALDTKATTDQITNLQSQIDLKANSSEVDSLEIEVDNLSTNKVDKVSGKGLSTNDYTTDEKNKLSGIDSGAQVNVIESVKVNGTALTPSSKSVNIDLSNYATKSDISSVYKYKGTVSTYADLPTTGQSVGDTYNVETADSSHGIKAGDNVAWNGSAWDVLSGTIDLSNYATVSQLNNKVDKVSGKGLSTNDFTNADKSKLDGIESGAEVNVIEDIKVDNVSLTPTNKSVNIDLSGKENVSNKTTSLSSASTDTQYPSAKAVYDEISPLETAISNLNQNVVKLDGNQAISGEKRFVHLGATSNLYNYVPNGQNFDVYILELPQEVGTLATQDYVDNIVGDIETLLEAI